MKEQEKLKGNLLIVDDEENIREILKAALNKVSKQSMVAGSAEEALSIVREENLDVIICDIQMPGMNGIDFLKQVKLEQPEIKFLMITAFGSMDVVINSMRNGASDFLTKPFDNNHLREIVLRLLREKKERKEPVLDLLQSSGIDGVIGQSRALKQCLNMALKAAASGSSTLIMGESGTGKEVIAKVIHANSAVSQGSFIAVNCGAIPENLMESELFGYEKGAFTGALEEKPGKFILANGGTIFLDEIGELPLSMQVKLLRVLQEKVVDPVGSVKSIPVEFKLIAATNKNLEEEVQAGRFREDLFYRLNIIPITLPPLRERGNDVLLLSEYFLEQFNERYHSMFTFSEEDKKALLAHHWPGNIRELENTLERAVVLGEDNQLALHLSRPTNNEEQHTSSHFKSVIKSSEKEAILKALESNRWNKTHTAKALGISRRSLLYKVKEYDI